MGPSAITKKVAGLENLLGVRLINRTTHGVALTDEGPACLERSVRMLAEMDGIEQLLAVRNKAALGHLRISVPYAIGQFYLAPGLRQY
jgi:DNA-binding transcriptional LysR family regulator